MVTQVCLHIKLVATRNGCCSLHRHIYIYGSLNKASRSSHELICCGQDKTSQSEPNISVTRRMGRETCGSICKAFIQRHGHIHKQGRTTADKYDMGKTQSNPRACVGPRSANNIQRA